MIFCQNIEIVHAIISQTTNIQPPNQNLNFFSKSSSSSSSSFFLFLVLFSPTALDNTLATLLKSFPSQRQYILNDNTIVRDKDFT